MAKRTAPAEPLSRKDVRELIELIRSNQIQEFELEQGDIRLRIVSSRPPVPGEAGTVVASQPYTPASFMPPPGYMLSHANALYPPPAYGFPIQANSGPPSGFAAAPANGAGAAAPPAPTTPTPAPGVKGAAPADDPSLIKITSPMVGTFYRAPAPDAKVFVDVGSRVQEETVLCIVEAMKLMNEIKAEVRGVVHSILVSNGQPVEYGQTLFLVQPT